MHNADLYKRYPNIMSLFESGFEDEVISYQTEACGEYVAYKRIYGTNVIFTQDQYGFISLECCDDLTLQHITEIYAENESFED